jgi:hypothetical protein
VILARRRFVGRPYFAAGSGFRASAISWNTPGRRRMTASGKVGRSGTDA